MPTKQKEATEIILPALEIEVVRITLIGDSRLVCHNWDEKAKQQMRDKQMKKPKVAKATRDPHADYLASLYVHPDGGYGFPAVAFKTAAVSACRAVDGVTMTLARGAFHVMGDLVKIEGEPNMREDMVRVGQGTADLRYRGEFPKWRTTFEVRHNARVIAAEQIVNLFNHAGFHVGVGEARPGKAGKNWGMFHVETKDELKG